MRIAPLLCLCSLSALAWAQDIEAPALDVAPLSAEEKQSLQDRAKALHEQAEAMRQQAEATYMTAKDACWQKFLVSDCQKDAQKAKTARLSEAHRTEIEARRLDRQLRQSEYAERQAKKAEQRGAR